MQLENLRSMTQGWFIGDFEPSVLRTQDFEVAVKRYPAGAREAWHVHHIATEITCIVSGKARMGNRDLGPGDIVRLEPGEGCSFETFEETTTVVVKTPSVLGDKYLGTPC